MSAPTLAFVKPGKDCPQNSRAAFARTGIGVPFEQPHQDAVRVGEILALVVKPVSTFGAVEEVVAQAPDDHQQREHSVARIVVGALDHGLDEVGVIRWPKRKKRKMVGQRAIGEIAVPEIAEFGVVEFSLEHSRLRPSVHPLADTIGAGEIAHDLGFKEAPQEGEVEDGAAVRIGKIPEARRARLEPLLAHAALRCLIVQTAMAQ